MKQVCYKMIRIINKLLKLFKLFLCSEKTLGMKSDCQECAIDDKQPARRSLAVFDQHLKTFGSKYL